MAENVQVSTVDTRDGDSQVDMVDLGKVLRQAGDERLSMEAVEVPRQNLLTEHLLLEECEEWRACRSCPFDEKWRLSMR
jgi:hypothetical protein